MIHDKLTYRFLDSSDKDEYVRLYKSFDTMMGVNIKEFPSETMDQMFEVFDAEPMKHVGGFTTNGKLMAALSGHFPKAPYWYCHSQFSAIPNSSLFGAVDILAANFQLHNLLLRFGEEHSYYSCYTRKTVKSQYTHELTRDRVSAKNIYKPRYEIYHDGYYAPGMPLGPVHDFWDPIPGVGSLIVLYVLNNEERKNLLKEKYPEYSSVYK
jgi:hypothetical protein